MIACISPDQHNVHQRTYGGLLLHRVSYGRTTSLGPRLRLLPSPLYSLKTTGGASGFDRDGCVLCETKQTCTVNGTRRLFFVLERHRGGFVGRSRQRHFGRSVVVIEIDGAVVRLSVFDPRCNDLLEFDEARVLVVPYEVSHLFEEGDALFEAVLFRLFEFGHLLLFFLQVLFRFLFLPAAADAAAPSLLFSSSSSSFIT